MRLSNLIILIFNNWGQICRQYNKNILLKRRGILNINNVSEVLMQI